MSGAWRFELRAVALRAGGSSSGRLLFDGLTFGVRGGDRWVVLGPNGSGKSSLLAAMAGVFPVADGDVLLEGRSLSNWRPQALADWRAWCPQFWVDPFPSTVAETARMAMCRGAWWNAGSPDSGPLMQLLDELDLGALADADVRRISGGERQRVAVATALLQETPLVLLDEPAAHLDLAHQQLLVAVLKRRSVRGRALVASLHDINLAWDLASHAVLLNGRGQALAGVRDEVMTADHLSEAFGVGVSRVEVCGQMRFWPGPVAASTS